MKFKPTGVNLVTGQIKPNYRKPVYTIEAGLGQNPLSISQFDEIYNDNIGILVLCALL